MGGRALVQKHCWGQRRPIERWSRTPGSQRGGRSGCKTKHCWGLGGAGSLLQSKSGPESVYYYSAVQYRWSIHPRETRSPGRPGWWAVPRVPVWVFWFFLPKVEVGLKSRHKGLSGPTGVVPTLSGLQQLVHSPPCCLCLMGECASAGTWAGRPDGPI